MQNNCFHKINLIPYLNKKIVFSHSKITDDAGLDGMGVYKGTFFDFNKTIELDNIPYIFRNKRSLDCIMCDNQNINLKPLIFKKLHFLGFMYWGANCDYLKLNYVDGRYDYIKIFFSDWSKETKPIENSFLDLFDLKPKTIGTFFSCGKAVLPIYLHHCEYENTLDKEIESITLPDNMLMHIFAITAEQSK